MSLRGFANDMRLKEPSHDHLLDSGDIALMLYARRHRDERGKGPFVTVAPRRKGRRRRGKALEITYLGLASAVVLGYAPLGSVLVRRLLSLALRLVRLMRIRRPPGPAGPT